MPFGFIGTWVDYLLISSLEPFTLTTLIFITLIWMPFSFMLCAIGGEDHSGEKPKPASNSEVMALFLGIPVGSLLSGIYLLSDAHWLPFECEFVNLLTLKSNDLLGRSLVALLVLFFFEMAMRKLKPATRKRQGDQPDNH